MSQIQKNALLAYKKVYYLDILVFTYLHRKIIAQYKTVFDVPQIDDWMALLEPGQLWVQFLLGHHLAIQRVVQFALCHLTSFLEFWP